MTKNKFCRSCGEKKRLTWPSEQPECCSMRCAAYSFLWYANTVGPFEAAHCNKCGELETCCECETDDAYNIVDWEAANELRDELNQFGEEHTTEEAIAILIGSGCACDEDTDHPECMHCEALEACGWWFDLDADRWRHENQGESKNEP